MNLLTITGNLTREPELTEVNGKNGPAKRCQFSVAVNDRRIGTTDFVRVTVWGALAEVCAKYLTKGKKVGCYGRVTTSAWIGKDGKPRASLELKADAVEFLTPGDAESHEESHNDFTPVDDGEDLPF